MAIEFVQCHVYSRSQGKSAVQAAAYRSADRLYDERLGLWFNYLKKPNVAHSEIMLPIGAHEQFLNREHLWNEVERVEKRKDSQLAKDYILALPKELNFEQNKDLASRFAHTYFVAKGLVVDLNIHLEEGNPHAHLFVTTRRLVGASFTLKARDLNPQFYASKVVEKDYFNAKWREFQESYFRQQGLDLFVDPNRLVPTRHRGRSKGDDRADYIDAENQDRHELEHEIALTSPEEVLKKLNQQFTVFSERDIARILNKATHTVEEFQHALIKFKAHPELVALGVGDDGRERYAAREAIKTEWQLEHDALQLKDKVNHVVPEWRVKMQIENYKLNNDQAVALSHVLTNGDLVAVVGKAGTGKSYLMNAARQAWESQGYRVLGIAVAGIATEGLEAGANIKSATIASFDYKLNKTKLTLTNKDILVLDEAGMVDSYQLQKLTSVRLNIK